MSPDKNVARGLPDLQADDPVITDQVTKAFPRYTGAQRADVVRCLAEYVEQTIAKNHGTVPPDGAGPQLSCGFPASPIRVLLRSFD